MPDLEDAYGLSTPEDSRRLYAEWARSYDEGFAAARGYVYPSEIARLAMRAPPRGRVLDVGAGTGLVGAALAGCGAPVDGLDISPEMLAEAGRKGVYDRLVAADLTRRLPIDDGVYGAVVSAGTFTHGHVGPECLPELFRIAARGARFALGINARVFDEAGFGSALAGAVAERLIGPLSFERIAIYRGAAHEAAEDRALVALFERG